MGQYFKVVNLDRREFLNPHAFDDGLKLLEFGCSSMGTLLGLTLLLRSSDEGGGGDFGNRGTVLPSMWERVGSWAGTRIVIAGDYDAPGKWIDEALLADERVQAMIKLALDANERDDTHWPVLPSLYGLCDGDIFRDISGEIIEIAQAGGEPIRFDDHDGYALKADPARYERILANARRMSALYGYKTGQTHLRPDMVIGAPLRAE